MSSCPEVFFRLSLCSDFSETTVPYWSRGCSLGLPDSVDLRNGTGQLWAWPRRRPFLPGWHRSGTRDTGKQKRINSPKAFHSEVFLGEKRASSYYSIEPANSGGWKENFQGTGVLQAWTRSLSSFILMDRWLGEVESTLNYSLEVVRPSSYCELLIIFPLLIKGGRRWGGNH